MPEERPQGRGVNGGAEQAGERAMAEERHDVAQGDAASHEKPHQIARSADVAAGIIVLGEPQRA
jgi:hypothetical protein